MPEAPVLCGTKLTTNLDTILRWPTIAIHKYVWLLLPAFHAFVTQQYKLSSQDED
ncbi:hypothetical protein HOLleu_41202 [Holothuria leucospilota]|uniref:Uncharacterized protein n=1 Tax=Holothuria leucospilota TaxID=206669 RepID=A0A9Q0YFJ6_HOLLE|nr:hypothetical protein HOLleu_41202 [Holothuria leucospilota]